MRGPALRYRDFLTVALMVRGRDLFPDNWIYIHEPGVKVGRIQNYTNWSPEMSPDPAMSCLGMEYFCFEGDGLWNSSDEDLSAMARREFTRLGLADAPLVEGTPCCACPRPTPCMTAAISGIAR
jgi:protoporphyrinogen oxidase